MKKTISFTDGANHDASVAETSTAFVVSKNLCYVAVATNAGTDLSPKFTIEVSIDDVTYFDLDGAVNLTTDTPYIASDSPWQYMRVKHIPNGATTGTTTYNINFKRK